MIRLFAAMTRDGIIAVNHELPCRLPDDLKFFQTMTHGRTVVMGHKTYQALGKALPNRHNLVLTREAWTMRGCEDVLYLNTTMMSVFDDYDVIGGAEVYRHFLEHHLVDEIYLTVMEFDVSEGILTRFPLDALHYDFDLLSPEIVMSQSKDDRNDAAFTVYKFIKRT